MSYVGETERLSLLLAEKFGFGQSFDRGDGEAMTGFNKPDTKV